MKELSDCYQLLERVDTNDIGCLYKYPEYSLSKDDVIAWTYEVTIKNNRLNLSSIVRELFDPKECYCTMCGEKYHSEKPNASRYCKSCAAKKEKARLAKVRRKSKDYTE